MKEYVTLYLDESGEKTWPIPYGNSQDRYYVLAGLVLAPEADLNAHRVLPGILEQFFPVAKHRPKELHYGDLINRREFYSGLSHDDAKCVADAVWDFIISFSSTLIGTVIDKKLMKMKYSDRAIDPNEYAMRSTIERYDRYLEETNRIGMVIVDTQSLEGRLQKIIHDAREDGIKISTPVGYDSCIDRRLDNVLNSVSFSPSYMSCGVQLADFIAYATRSHFERCKSNRYSQINKLWRRSGSFREPSIIPSGSPARK